jgi:nicotinate (nicotinamide) nucleotide adenylyltransferase
LSFSWSDVTAVFGGAFDPPHLGHRAAIAGLFDCPGVKRVLVLPSPAPAHKPCIASAQARLEMARIGLLGRSPGPYPEKYQGEVRLDMREIERHARTGKPTYTYDLLLELRAEFPLLAFVLGADQAETFHTWHRFPDVLKLSHWIVLERKPEGGVNVRKVLQNWEASGICRPAGDHCWKISGSETTLKVVPTLAPALSSTAIREAIVRNGQPPENTLTAEVSAYLKLHRIYGTS